MVITHDLDRRPSGRRLHRGPARLAAGHDNTTARTVAIRQGEPINATALLQMFQQIIANNRAGGWRKLKRQH
jgi:hypothetical protein